MTAYLVYPIEYLAPLYVTLYGLWLIRENKAILFWLYLWQLKEYHWGRFFDHFSTAKGKRIFLNPIFIAKAVVLIFFLSVYFFIKNSGNGSYFFSPASSFFFSRYYSYAFYFFAFSVFLIFAFEAAWTFILIFKRSIIHPVLTKKSILLIATVHLAAFASVFVLYGSILGEMGLLDFAIAAFCLLLFDLLTPLFVGLAVMIFQPLTVWEKNKVLKRAKTAREARPDLAVVGISGSYGKSITKELLAHVLAQKSKVLKTAANQNTEVGVSNALINGLEADHKFFVCEIGAVHKGKIKLVANAVMPKVGILTGINQQHMAVFGSQQNITEGKYEILESLGEDGTAVANWSSELVRQSFESKKAKIRAKNIVLAAKDIFASDVRAETGCLSFKASCKGESAFFEINARGAFNVEPILLAMAGAISCGMGFKEVAGIIAKTDFSPFNVKVNDRADGVKVISSTYSANPDGVAAHLEYLKLWPGKKAVVMPCLIELGKSSKEIHFKIGQKIAAVCDLAVITTKDRFGEIIKGAVSAGMKKENIVFAERPPAAEKKIREAMAKGDTILLEGRLPQGMVEKLER
jgi:UDP-N-acetylmuramoyl-tripeptide--D-alanyl-D-alanine ligase